MKKSYPIKFIALIPYLLITFAIAWGILGLYIFLPEKMSATFGQLSGNHPLFFLAVWAPGIAAFSIILVKTGFKGLKTFLSRLKIWRTDLFWYLMIFLFIPIVFYIGAAINGNLFSEPYPLDSLKALPLALFLGLIKGPIEEFGWRGFAQPLMQRKFSPFWTGIIMGIIWGLWHLPAFLASGTEQSGWGFLPFFMGTITISMIMTALYNSSRGSLLLSGILHFQFMNPIWPDARPYDTYLLVLVVIVIVIKKRKAIFNKDAGITDIISVSEKTAKSQLEQS